MKQKQPPVRMAVHKETKQLSRAWKVGDKVMKQGMQGIYEITRISRDGSEVWIGTNFELFRVPIELILPAKHG